MDGIVCVCICEVQIRKTWKVLAVGVCWRGDRGEHPISHNHGLLNESWNPSSGVLTSLLMGQDHQGRCPGDVLALEDGAGAQALPSLRPA